MDLPPRFAALSRLDPRSIALFRVGLGAVLLADLGMRADRLAQLSSDAGPVTRASLGLTRTLFPAYLVHGSPGWAHAVTLLAAMSALALLVGWWSRAAALVSWFLLCSLHVRNPYVTDGGDQLLRLLLLLGAFLPLGACWSLDARSARAARAVPPFAALALLLQFALFYGFAGALKLRFTTMWRDGTAIQRVLARDNWATDLGRRVGELGGLSWLSYLVLVFELAVPVLLLSPWRTAHCRVAAVIAIALFHFGLGLHLELGLLPWVCVVGACAFLPGAVWRRAAAPPAPGEAAPRWRELLSLGLASVIVVINLATLLKPNPLPRLVRRAASELFLDQTWAFYTQAPEEIPRGFVVVRATLADGDVVNLANAGRPVQIDPAPSVARRFDSFRWATLLEASLHHTWMHPGIAESECQRHNQRAPAERRADRVEIVLVDLDGALPEPRVLWAARCPADTTRL